MRDWLDIVARVEGHYRQTQGTAQNQDETLRSLLVPFANDLFQEIERDGREPRLIATTPFVTTPGVSVYALPSTFLLVDCLYWEDANSYPTYLDKDDKRELMPLYGDQAATQQGAPRKFSLDGANIQIYPTPDSAGPTSGNYTINIEGYVLITPITETTATTNGTTSVTIPSANFLTKAGVATSGSFVSIRGAGYPQSATVNDFWQTGWSSLTGTTATVLAAPATNVTTAQCFFNSKNFLIGNWPKLVLFGVLREVAAYLANDGDMNRWNSRYEEELTKFREFQTSYQRSHESTAAAIPAQNDRTSRRRDYPLNYEIRGGG